MYRLGDDSLLGAVSSLLVMLASSIVGLVIVFLLLESLPVINATVADFFSLNEPWYPLEGKRGLLPMIVGSFLCALGSMILALPLGVASALFLQHDYHALMTTPYRWLLGLLAGIPSVVFGFWGLTVLVPLIATYRPPGASLLAGMVILTLMVLPTVALTAEAALRAVPLSYIQAGHSLGLRKSAIAFKILIPAARRGILAGAVLALTRALGETMAVMMVTGNVVAVPDDLFDPVRTLTSNIALEMAYALKEHRASLFFSGLVLTVAVALLASLAQQPEHSRS